MTLSAEARAAAVVRDYYATDLDVINGAEGEKRTIEALIAKAIREACNEKLEEAKRRIRMTAIMSDDGHANRDFLNGIAFAAERLDALNDPTP